MICKILQEPSSIKEYFFQKLKIISGPVQSRLPRDITKEDFDKTPVLERFNHQLKNSGLKTNHTLSPSFEWACEEIEEIKKNYKLNKYILLLPFCSQHLTSKKWPYYNELIKIILNKFNNEYKIVIAPGPSEISQAKDFNATWF